jgi:hypothetical protein
MDSFYLTVLSIASVILILALTYVGILLYYSERSEVFPPLQNACPDYWYLEPATGKCRFPVAQDSKNRGNYKTASGASDGLTQSGTNPTTAVIDSRVGTNILATNSVLFDMNHADWENKFGKKSALCNKKYWANLRGITWDGVTNTNQC